jgi:hypothetical protein
VEFLRGEGSVFQTKKIVKLLLTRLLSKASLDFDSITSLKVTLVQGLHTCQQLHPNSARKWRGGERVGEETIQMSVNTRLLCSPITSRKEKIIQGYLD